MNPSKILKLSLSFVAGFLVACSVFFKSCDDKYFEAFRFIKKMNDSLEKVNSSLQAQKLVINKELQVSKGVVLSLEKRLIKKEYEYKKNKESGLEYFQKGPCDSVQNLIVYTQLADACDSLQSVKDSIISMQVIQIDLHDNKDNIQEEQIKNLTTMYEGAEAISKYIEENNKSLHRQLRRQKIKTFLIGSAGVAATAISTYFLLKK